MDAFMVMQNAAFGIQSSEVHFKFPFRHLGLWFPLQNSYILQNVGKNVTQECIKLIILRQFSCKCMDGLFLSKS